MKKERIEILSKLSKVNKVFFSHLSILGCVSDNEVEHMDIDVFIILKEIEEYRLSNFDCLKRLILEIKNVCGDSIYAFSTFKHQMYFSDELKKRNIYNRPVHMLIYPNFFYLVQWEIPSRILSMFSEADSLKTTASEYSMISRSSEKYNPYPFLQVLYEAYISYTLSNINSDAVFYDVVKKIEFSVKNLTLEAFLKMGICSEEFSTDWKFLTSHLSNISSKNIDTSVLNESFSVRKNGYNISRSYDFNNYFCKAFEYYDSIVKNVF